ncbi:hypothetical protein [Aestuariimicrobium ganziense]|uniref:hypothetical protein n=1 Tax=Aestuariimicrobium ganziense TaxID=2773677 RepID=UPI0019412FD1|nr:hypothetical protein [Aestuariimicrobium ganziense]
MGIGRKLASLASAVVLAGAGVIGLGQTAFGAAGVTATSVDVGQANTITITGCSDAAVYSGAVVQIVRIEENDEVVPVQELPVATTGQASASVTWTAPQAGAYYLQATCLGYNGNEDSAAEAGFFVYPTSLFVEPSSWSAGDPVTVSAYGFTPGETVSLKMVDVSTGATVWSDAAVARANDDGTFSYELVLKSDVPEGSYYLIATGDDSGKTRTLEFYWGSPDEDDNGGDSGGPVSPNPGGGGGGLPSTGN